MAALLTGHHKYGRTRLPNGFLRSQNCGRSATFSTPWLWICQTKQSKGLDLDKAQHLKVSSPFQLQISSQLLPFLVGTLSFLWSKEISVALPRLLQTFFRHGHVYWQGKHTSSVFAIFLGSKMASFFHINKACFEVSIKRANFSTTCNRN